MHEFAGDDLTIPQCTVPTTSLTLPAMLLDRTDVAEVIRSAWQALGRFNPDNDDDDDLAE